jgi:lantibiotic leader peptide-processing serine protease
MKQPKVLVAVLAAAAALVPLAGSATASQASMRYMVVLAGNSSGNRFAPDDTRAAALGLVADAGGTVVHDLSSQIGVLVVDSPNVMFDELMRSSPLVIAASEDVRWKAFASVEELAAQGARVLSHEDIGVGGPEPGNDPGEALQWDMEQINTPAAHAKQGGARLVDVGVLDSGMDGRHPEFLDDDGSNVDCARGRNFVPLGPSPVGTPDPCMDNQFHGTHVAGTIGARANGVGIVGVAPNVTIVPIKVCDSAGFCYSSSSVAAITYAGDIQLDVINMSYFVDDDQFLGSTEFKCANDDVQRTLRHANERAIVYARSRGVTPLAALGNSDSDLAHPNEPYENNCEVVPAETQGVVGTMAVGRESEKAAYSSYGTGATDVAAPGGNGTTGDCTTTILSTFPGGGYLCIQGTSMASPHSAGVAALIVSQFGTLGTDGDVKMPPQKVENYLQSTTVDIGRPGYDECFGNGRIDALKAVNHDTARVYDGTAPFCPEYEE